MTSILLTLAWRWVTGPALAQALQHWSLERKSSVLTTLQRLMKMLTTISAFYTFISSYMVLIPTQTGAFLVSCCHQKQSQLWRRWFSTLPLLAAVAVMQQQIWDSGFVTTSDVKCVVYFHVSQVPETIHY